MHHTRFARSFTVRPFGLGLHAVCLFTLLLPLLGGPATASTGSASFGTTREMITPPVQPATGPGGRHYRFNDVTAARAGDVPTGAWVYTPGGTTEEERGELPVVVFLHGFGGTDPEVYGEWLQHLARRGAVVIFPDYQEPGFFEGGQGAYLGNMFTGVDGALDLLDAAPDRVHVVGHSLGAVLTAAYGVLAPGAGLPPAATLTMIEPGGCRTCGNFGSFGVPLPLDRQIPAETLVRTVVGGDDDFVGDADARSIQRMLAEVPADSRVFELIPSDDHGAPALVADHLFPQTGGSPDALDWFGLWRPLDALISCADAGQDCEIALGDGDGRRFMGEWSDGTPVCSPVPVT